MWRNNPLKIAVGLFCIAMCLISFLVHFFTNIDLEIQKNFYLDNHWIVDPSDPVLYLIFYNLPKVIVICIGVYALFVLLRWKFGKITLTTQAQIALITFIICVSLFPIFINFLKDIFRQPCPRDLAIFGGTYDGNLWSYFLNKGDNKCFPGAHAAAPFSLVSMKYFFNDSYNKGLFYFILIPFATMVSMYQVVRGVHFISDTTFTAFSSWLFAEFIYLLVFKKISNSSRLS